MRFENDYKGLLLSLELISPPRSHMHFETRGSPIAQLQPLPGPPPKRRPRDEAPHTSATRVQEGSSPVTGTRYLTS